MILKINNIFKIKNMEDIYKLNLNYLIKYHTKKELQNILSKIEGKTIWKDTNDKLLNKEQIASYILKYEYNIKPTEDINKLILDYEHKKKLEYYNSLPNKIYEKSNKVFNANYEKPCLEYKNNSKTYPQIKILGKTQFVYRISYAIYNNIFIEDIPKINSDGEKLQICHGKNCSKFCIEPTHLELKTQSCNNYEDKIRDNTLLIGVKNKSSKISQETAEKIKKSKNNGTQRDRAKNFEVPLSIVVSIDSCSTWTHINNDDTTIKRFKKRKKYKENKEKILSKDDYIRASEILKEKSIISLDIKYTVDTPCHIYQGYKDKDGYGQINFMGVNYRVNRLSYEASIFSKINFSEEKKIIRHLCNVKECCNPQHLCLGTYKENRIDMAKNNHKNNKLTEKDVIEIKNLLRDSKLTQTEIGNKFNVNNSVISSIKNGKSWSYLK
jgi:hypothetical protein